ncbi:hypothetical protein BC834DRAFT_885588 [Gloeopeniophorella convolvens]|nr:hypothetical protein BC834DRAFT_885588 [Gloeopeniophorella convolvens]
MTSTIASLLSLLLSPLASTIFTVRSSQVVHDVPVKLVQDVGFPANWDALIPAYNAVNVASSIFLSNGSMLPYATSEWAFPMFEIDEEALQPHQSLFNTTLELTMTGIITAANCEDTSITWSFNNSVDDAYPYKAEAVGKISGARIAENFTGYGGTQLYVPR